MGLPDRQSRPLAEPAPKPAIDAESLESQAWSAYNLAFHAPDAEQYRQAGRDLYRQVFEERLQALFVKGDEQNRLLDSRTHA